MKVRRAELMFPINIPRFVEKAWTRSTDAIALDLEDSVPPEEKATARALVKEYIPRRREAGAISITAGARRRHPGESPLHPEEGRPHRSGKQPRIGGRESQQGHA